MDGNMFPFPDLNDNEVSEMYIFNEISRFVIYSKKYFNPCCRSDENSLDINPDTFHSSVEIKSSYYDTAYLLRFTPARNVGKTSVLCPSTLEVCVSS